MNPLTLAAAVLTALCAAMVARVVVAPTRRLKPRVQIYAQLARSRLGVGIDPAAVGILDPTGHRSPIGRVLAPIAASIAQRLARLLDTGDDDALTLRLRQAGYRDLTPERYRLRQLAWTTGGLALGAAVGLVVTRSAVWTLALTLLGGVVGATHWRGKVNTAITRRRERMRVELYTVAHLLAMYARTGHGPNEAVRELCGRGAGPVVDELDEALGWIQTGTRPHHAWERLADTTPEPAAARLYRLLAAHSTTGGDITTSLLATADELRVDRREEIERQAVRRRGAMLLPTIALMAPVVLLFILAALPTVIFGR